MPRATDNAHEPAGAFEPVCAWCGLKFRTDNERTKYHSTACAKAAANARYYERHADRMREANNERQKAQRRRLKALED